MRRMPVLWVAYAVRQLSCLALFMVILDIYKNPEVVKFFPFVPIRKIVPFESLQKE